MEIMLSALLFALVACITPGPNNIMIMASGLNYGVRRTMPHLLGISIGFPAMFIGVGVGLGTLFESFPALHGVVKVLGISFLLYLAYRIATTTTGPELQADSRPMRFMEAVLFQWVNPKAWVNCIGAIAAFTTVSGDVLIQALWIALAFFVVCFPSVSVWLISGAALSQWLHRPQQRRAFNLVMAFLLALSVLPMVTTEFGV